MQIVEETLPKPSRFRLLTRFRERFSSYSKKKKTALVSAVLFIFLLLAATSVYAFVSYRFWNSDAAVNNYRSTGDIEVGLGEPLDFESPINGILYTRAQGEVFDQRRPLAIMVNNHVDARPIQAGLPAADIIFEAVAEGGITRFLAIYHANDAEKIGPVRSVRVYYLDWALEFHPWVAHWGGASTLNSPANAYDYMAKNGVANLDAMWLGECSTCPYWRDLELGVSMEHTGFTGTQKLYRESAKRWPDWAISVPFDRWIFKDEPPEADRPSAGSFTLNFWNLPNYEVTWAYAPADNSYKRTQGGEPHKDSISGEQLTAKNVVVQYVAERAANDGTPHLLYQTVGSGQAKILLDGKIVEARWEKKDRLSRTRYFDAVTGEEIKFNRGQIWVEIVPAGSE